MRVVSSFEDKQILYEESREGHVEGSPREDQASRRPSSNPGEMSQGKPTLLTPLSWTSSLPTCEKINFYCFGLPVRGIL